MAIEILFLVRCNSFQVVLRHAENLFGVKTFSGNHLSIDSRVSIDAKVVSTSKFVYLNDWKPENRINGIQKKIDQDFSTSFRNLQQLIPLRNRNNLPKPYDSIKFIKVKSSLITPLTLTECNKSNPTKSFDN